MTDTTFVDQQTIIQASWCNDINDHVYNNTPISPGTTVHPSSVIQYTPSGTGAIPRTVQTKLREYISVNDFGAIGDGVTDDTAAIQAAINAAPSYSIIRFNGVYLVSSTITISKDNIILDLNGSRVFAKAATNFDFIFSSTGRTNVTIKNGDIDANKANRTTGQTIRFMAVLFTSCTDCVCSNLRVTGTRGFGGISAVGIAISSSTRTKIENCTVYNCGDTGFDSDAIYTSGTQNIISNCTASNCTDTGFVIENSDFSVISGCSSYGCAAGAGITNASVDNHYGNVISGLTVQNWSGSSTGGVQIGALSTGNLYDSEISGLVMYANTTSFGFGPAIYIRSVSSGRPIGVNIVSPRINGSKNQGIFVGGDNVSIIGANIKNVTDSCIQFQTGAVLGYVANCYLVDGSYGVTGNGTSECVVQSNTFRGQTQYSMYAFGTSTIRALRNICITPSIGAISKDSGATLLQEEEVVLPYSTVIATDASLSDKFVVTATDGVAFAFSGPINSSLGQVITYTIRNASGGALGAITWGSVFKLATLTSPANGFSRSVTFKYNGSNWVQISQTGVDVPN